MADIVAIGIGCRRGVKAADVAAVVQRTLAEAGLAPANATLFSVEGKADEAGLAEAARRLAMPLVFLSEHALATRAAEAQTRSARVEALYGLPSIAETAVLAGAGAGSRLVVRRVSGGGATCAIAVGNAP
ncbi:MAG: cobalamin biosynthesis protein [Beijerinckiaceae bacterium]